MTSGNYRAERTNKIRYSIDNIDHEQYLHLIFLKIFIYTNIFYEIQQQLNLNPKEKIIVTELISENKKFIEAILKNVSFNETNGNSINQIFKDRISKIEM